MDRKRHRKLHITSPGQNVSVLADRRSHSQSPLFRDHRFPLATARADILDGAPHIAAETRSRRCATAAQPNPPRTDATIPLQKRPDRRLALPYSPAGKRLRARRKHLHPEPELKGLQFPTPRGNPAEPHVRRAENPPPRSREKCRQPFAPHALVPDRRDPENASRGARLRHDPRWSCPHP